MLTKETLAKKAREDIIAGILFALFAIGYYAETYRFRVVKVTNTIDATFMPRVLACLVFACSVILSLQGYLRYRRIPSESRRPSQMDREKGRAGALRCLAVIAVLVLAASVFRKLGFILTMPWMMFLIFIIIEKKEKRNYKLYLLLSIVSPIVLFMLFYYGFSQLLPMGMLKPFLSRIL